MPNVSKGSNPMTGPQRAGVAIQRVSLLKLCGAMNQSRLSNQCTTIRLPSSNSHRLNHITGLRAPRVCRVSPEVQSWPARSVRSSDAPRAFGWNEFVPGIVAHIIAQSLGDLPRQTRRSVGVLSVEQAREFMTAIVGHPYEALFGLAMTSGMRPSEYLALTWADIDLVRGTVSVSRTLEWKTDGWQFADTKRSRSRRVIKLQAWVIASLEKHRQSVDRRDDDNPARNLVFVAKCGEPIRESRFARRHFKPLLRKAGLPNIRLYDLRHLAASLALAAGVSPKVISEQLGHSSVAFTLDVYSHVLPHMQDAAAEKVQALLVDPTTAAMPRQAPADRTPVTETSISNMSSNPQ